MDEPTGVLEFSAPLSAEQVDVLRKWWRALPPEAHRVEMDFIYLGHKGKYRPLPSSQGV